MFLVKKSFAFININVEHYNITKEYGAIMAIKAVDYPFLGLALRAQKGDTWNSVSEQFNVSPHTLKRDNKQSAELSEGQLFVVMLHAARVHVVAPTETLESICVKHNITKQQLGELNGNNLFLFVGKKLYLPKNTN